MKSRRLHWLLAALAATALLVVWGDAPVANVAAAPSPRPVVTTERDAVIRALLPREMRDGRGIDPFAVAPPASEVPPAAAVVPTARPAGSTLAVPTFPEAPPYRVIGKQQEEGDGWAVFLARGEETWVVREGDILGDDYRVAAIKPPLLTLAHAKSRARRTIDIGEAKE